MSTSPKSGSIGYASSVSMFAKKQSNGGIAQDAGSVSMLLNGVKQNTGLDEINFSLGDNVSNLSYVMTGISPGDVIEIHIEEG